MTPDQFTELVEFLGRKFDQIDRRFDGVDARLDALERRVSALQVSHEAMRDDIMAALRDYFKDSEMNLGLVIVKHEGSGALVS